MKQIRILIMLTTVLFTLSVGASTAPAQQGVLSLNTPDFQKAGMAQLDGEWSFYWQQLLSPTELDTAPTNSSYMSVPGLWNKGAVGELSYNAFGYATLVLDITLPKNQHHYFLKLQSLPSAYTLWANNELVVASGVVGTSQNEEQPWFSPNIIPVYVESGALRLVLQISNFHHKEGGVWRSFILATDDKLFDIQDLPVISDSILFAMLFSIGLYYITLFLMRREERAAFYFGLFCLSVGFRSILVGERIFYGFDSGLSWSVLMMLEHQFFYLSLPTFTWFFYYLYPQTVGRWLPRACTVVCFMAIFATLTLPTHLYALLSFPYQLFVLLMSVPVFFYTTQLISKKSKGSFLFGLSFLFLAVLVIHDVLYTNFIVHGRPMVPLGVIAFVITQSMILNRRYVHSLSLVEAMTRELQSRNEELVKLDQVKDEFLAHTSHELRTPIHGIVGLTQALMKDNDWHAAGSQSHQLKLIESSAKRLGHLVNEILDFSQLKHQELSLKLGDVNLASTMGITLRLLEPLVANKPVEFKAKLPSSLPMVKADENRLQQILFNLIGNSIKYTQRGEILVKAVVLDGFVEISIEDTGMGISAAHRDVLFEPFKQLDSSVNNGIEGTGLGLSITQKLLELHNSELFIDSEEGVGTRVHFILPIASGALISDARTEQFIELSDIKDSVQIQLSNSQDLLSNNKELSYRILVVDDEEVNRQVIYSQLSTEGYQVLLCASGEDALEILEQGKPDLILLDLMMPQMNGLEVCDAVREQYDRFELPILMLTASHQMDDVVKSLNIGANDYLSKPYHEAELLARVYSLISASESHKRAEENKYLQAEIVRRKEAQDKLRQANQRLVGLLDNAEKSSPVVALQSLTKELTASRDRINSLEKVVQEIVSITSPNIDTVDENTHVAFEKKESAKIVDAVNHESGAKYIKQNETLPKSMGHHLYLVNTLRLALSLWEQYSGKGKVELAEESKIWRVYIDGSTVKTRTLDKYLSIKTLPKKPRWRSVVRTANFVKLQCNITESERQEIDHLIDTVEDEFLEAAP